MSFGMCISAGNTCGFPVLERQEKLKYSLNVMGCRIAPYWLGAMAFDWLVSCIPILVLVILLCSLDLVVMVNFGTIYVLLSA